MKIERKYLGLFLNFFIIVVWTVVTVFLSLTIFEKKPETKIYQPNYEEMFQKESNYQAKDEQNDYKKKYKLAFEIMREEDGSFRVASVRANSDASGQGLQVGDKLVSIGGFSVDGKTEEELRSLMIGKRSDLITVVVKRNDTTDSKYDTKITLNIFPDLEIE